LRIRQIPGRVGELEVSGELDYHSSQRLREHIGNTLKDSGGSVRLRLDAVEFIDSTGLSVLLDAVKTAASMGGTVSLVRPSPQLVRVLKVSGFAPFFQIDEDGRPTRSAASLERTADLGLRIESFEAEGRPENIGALRRSVVKFAEDLPFTRQELDDIKLAVGEATCNALRYGCPTGAESIHITCTRNGGRFSVDITDSGPGFDPSEVPEVNEGELAEGGRGIFFMRCLMDEVNFSFNNGTTVQLVKHIPESPASDAGCGI